MSALTATRSRLGASLRGALRTKRARLTSAVLLAAAVAALVASVAVASLSANGFGTGSASTGSVSLTVNAPATHACTYNALSPGDLSGSKTCSLSVSYGGSVAAYVSLSVLIESKPGRAVGAKTLYDPTDSSGLSLAISDGHRSFTVPAGAGTTGGSCPAGERCWTSADDLAAWYSGSTADLTFTSTSPAVTWTVTPLFPTGVGNAYQGATATLLLTAQAVQAPGNPLPASCTTTTIGTPCAATWS